MEPTKKYVRRTRFIIRIKKKSLVNHIENNISKYMLSMQRLTLEKIQYSCIYRKSGSDDLNVFIQLKNSKRVNLEKMNLNFDGKYEIYDKFDPVSFDINILKEMGKFIPIGRKSKTYPKVNTVNTLGREDVSHIKLEDIIEMMHKQFKQKVENYKNEYNKCICFDPQIVPFSRWFSCDNEKQHSHVCYVFTSFNQDKKGYIHNINYEFIPFLGIETTDHIEDIMYQVCIKEYFENGYEFYNGLEELMHRNDKNNNVFLKTGKFKVVCDDGILREYMNDNYYDIVIRKRISLFENMLEHLEIHESIKVFLDELLFDLSRLYRNKSRSQDYKDKSDSILKNRPTDIGIINRMVNSSKNNHMKK